MNDRAVELEPELIAAQRVLGVRRVLEIAHAESSASSLKKLKTDPCGELVPLLVTTLMSTPRYEPYSADVLPVWTWIASTASAIGRMLVAASRLDDELMPSSDRLFWISRWPAPLKLRPMSLLSPPSTPGVVLARLQTLRPFNGRSTIARWPMVSETTALSVSSTCASASTLTDSASAADLHHGVGADHLVVGDLDAGGFEGLKSVRRDRDVVGAGAHELDVVVPSAFVVASYVSLVPTLTATTWAPGHDQIAAVGHRADQRRLRSQLRRCVAGANNPRHRSDESRRSILSPSC